MSNKCGLCVILPCADQAAAVLGGNRANRSRCGLVRILSLAPRSSGWKVVREARRRSKSKLALAESDVQTCTGQPAQGDLRSQNVLAQSILQTCVEQLAQSACSEQRAKAPAQSTSEEQLAENVLRAEFAQGNLHKATCAEHSAKMDVQTCTEHACANSATIATCAKQLV